MSVKHWTCRQKGGNRNSSTELRKSQVQGNIGPMPTTADRVKQVIEGSGMSQGDFAAAVGLDASKMSKSLAGTRRFTSLDLASIADQADVTVDWLLSGREAPLATAARAASGSATEQAVLAAQILTELRETATEIGYPQPWRPLESLGAKGLATDQGEALAKQALERLAVAQTSTLDLATLIESAFGVDVCITEIGGGIDGLSASTSEAKLVLAAPTSVGYRQRFTMAHELGHLLANDDQGIHLDRDVLARTRELTEWRANAFASAFLMPEPELRSVGRLSEETFCRLACELRVSPAALAVRLERLRLIDGMTKDQWRSITAATAAQRSGSVADLAASTTYSSTKRPPGLLARDLLQGYLDGRTTLRPYARLLGVDTETLRRELEQKDAQVPDA